MTLRTLYIVLCVAFAQIGSASATIYYDLASWLAAVGGPVRVGPYTGNVTIIDIITTAKSVNGECCTIVDQTSRTSPGTFDNFSWRFNLIGTRIGPCSNCTVTTPSERIVEFDPTFVGFYSLHAIIGNEGPPPVGLINGDELSPPEQQYFGFFGWVGSGSLDFSDYRPLNVYLDENAGIDLLNIQVPIFAVEEPSTRASLLAGLALLCGASVCLGLWRRDGEKRHDFTGAA
jgi:hypothetical protein